MRWLRRGFSWLSVSLLFCIFKEVGLWRHDVRTDSPKVGLGEEPLKLKVGKR